MNDMLDDLLDASAPAPLRISDADARAMIGRARDEARPVQPRAKKAAIATGVLALLMAGGGSVAFATGLVEWPAGFEDPDSSFVFALPSGRSCEVRLVVDDVDAEAAAGENRAQTEVDRWLNTVDLEAALDMPAAQRETDRILEEQRALGMSIVIAEDGWLTDAPATTGAPTPDDAYAFAVNRAVGAAMTEHLLSAGLPENEWTVGAKGGVKCAAE